MQNVLSPGSGDARFDGRRRLFRCSLLRLLPDIRSPATTQVYKAVLGGVQTVAVKMLAGQQDPAAQAKFCREVAILRSCRNSNIVQFQVCRARSWSGTAAHRRHLTLEHL